MNGWDREELDDICSLIADCPHSTPDWTEEGVFAVRSWNVRDGKLNFDKPSFVDEDTYQERVRRAKPALGDIVITREAPMGEVCLIPDGLKCCLGQRLVLIRGDVAKADHRFLSYSLQSHYVQGQIMSHEGSGSTVSNLRIEYLKKLKIPLPPLPLQRRIAEILSRYDALIDNYQRQITALENLAQEIYREWFVRGRCLYAEPGEDGGLPVGWEKKTVEDCFQILGGGTPSREDSSFWEDGTVNWFTPTDITGSGGFFLNESSEKITGTGLSSCSARLFPAYSVMMTSRATIGAVAINTQKATTNQGFIVCLPNEQFSFAFIYFWVTHNKHIFEMLASGATFLEIPKSIFKKIEIVTPRSSELVAFDKIVIPIFKKIENIQTQLSTLRQTRDALLPRLLSGQLAVGDALAD